MKTIKNAQVTLTAGKLFISADVVDEEFKEILLTRVTHGYLNPDNIQHHRHVQSSNAGVFIRHAQHVVSIPNDVLAKIASVIEPRTTFIPVLKHGVKPPKVEVSSELPVSYKWQVSDNPRPESDKPHTPPPPAVWDDIDGQTTDTLDESKIETGKWARCIISNASGSVITPAVKKI